METVKKEYKDLELYVKHTSNCPGIPLTIFKVLSETWSGESVMIPFEKEDGKFKKVQVVGWTDLFMGSTCQVNIVKVIAPDNSRGYLVYGGNSGVRVLDKVYQKAKEKEARFLGIEAHDKHLPGGYGTPLIFIELQDDLPKDVLEIVEPD